MNWSTVQLEAWLVNVMGLPAVAKAAEGDVDGGTAVENDGPAKLERAWCNQRQGRQDRERAEEAERHATINVGPEDI